MNMRMIYLLGWRIVLTFWLTVVAGGSQARSLAFSKGLPDGAASPATTGPQPPSFQTQPSNVIARVDSTTNFSALAVGSQPIAYQWYKGSQTSADMAIVGATSNVFTLVAAESNAGPFYVAASNSIGVSTSVVANLTLSYLPITSSSFQPADQTVTFGANVSLTVVLTSGSKPRYQWFLNAAPLLNVTNATLTLSNVTQRQMGYYQAKVYNPVSTNYSRSALLTVTRPPFMLVGTNQVWSYDDTGTDGGTAWSAPSYPGAGTWPTGLALLGFKTDLNWTYLPTDPAVTPLGTFWGTFRTRLKRVSSVTGATNMTYYLRTTFNNDGSLASPGMGLTFSNLIDDGAITYLNGVEINRYNMPTGAVNSLTGASQAINASAWYSFTLPGTLLLPGTNVIAAELHQFSLVGNDADWLSLLAATYPQPGALTITNQPADTVVQDGRSAVLNVGVSNSDFVWVEYQWYRVVTNQIQAVAGATSSRLQIPFAQYSQDAGAYFVTVSNPVFSVNSRQARLTVTRASPLVAAAPSNTTVCFGQPAAFHVTAYGTPPLAYQWSHDGVPIPGATNAECSVTAAATAEMAGLYAVVITNAQGMAASPPAVLRVVPYEPVFSLQPADVLTAPGQPVVFSTEVTGCPSPSCQWQCNGTNIPDATNAFLTLSSVQLSQAGLYRVVASNEAGVTLSGEAHLFLPTLGETLNCLSLNWTNQTATPWLPQNQVTHDGFGALQATASKSAEQSTLLTAATGPARVSFWWKLQAADAAAKLEFLVDGTTQLSLTGRNDWQQAGLFIPSGSHALSWRFSVNNSTNHPGAWLDEVVYDPTSLAPFILAPPSDLSLAVGEVGTLQVSAIGIPPLHYQWQADGVTLPGTDQAACTVPLASASGTVTFTVIVSDDYGAATAIARVTATNCAPRFSRGAQFVRAQVGGEATIPASAYGTLPLSFQWWCNGVLLPGETNAVLRWSQVQTRQAGSYWVVASNPLGTARGPTMTLLVGRARHVIHLSVDGMGATYLAAALSNTPARYPSFARLVAEGASTMNARCDCTDSITVPNHLCMLTGRPVRQPDGQPNTVPHGFTPDCSGSTDSIHKLGNTNVPYKASVLDVAHDYGLQTALMVSKSCLAICAASYNATNGAPDLAPPDNGRNKIDHVLVTNGSSSTIVDAFLPVFTNTNPCEYAFLHFADPDLNGHGYGWGSSNYFAALQTVDTQLGRILAAMDQSPDLEVPGQTTLIVTADHGGEGHWHDHLPPLVNDYTIPILVWGAGFSPATDLYSVFANRADPGANWLDYNALWQPLRNGDTGNLALALLGLPPIPGSTMIPVFFTLPPTLSVRPLGSGVRVAWPTAAAGFTLQTSAQIGSAAVWLPVTQGIVTNATQFSYDLTPKASPRFFRLSR